MGGLWRLGDTRPVWRRAALLLLAASGWHCAGDADDRGPEIMEVPAAPIVGAPAQPSSGGTGGGAGSAAATGGAPGPISGMSGGGVGTGGSEAGMGGGSLATGGSGGFGGGSPGSGGIGGAGGMGGGAPGSGGMGAGGMGAGDAGVMPDAGGEPDSGVGGEPAEGESGRVAGMVAAHNAARAEVGAQPPLPDLTWSNELAELAQDWADQLAGGCGGAMHRPQGNGPGRVGENIAMYGTSANSSEIGNVQGVVDGWAGEVACWDYGTILGTEQCDMACTSAMNSNGCGHYTQVVWRGTMQVGCGVQTCQGGGLTREYWVCNYDPPGNVVGQAPY